MGNLVYGASCSGVLYAFDRDTGDVRWTYDTSVDGVSAQFHGDPVVIGELLVIPSDARPQGWVYAFEHATGKLRWKTPVAPGGVTSHLVRAGSAVIGLDPVGTLVAFDLDDGAPLWSVEAEVEPGRIGLNTHPALAGERVYYGAPDGRVRAVEVRSGAVIWTTELGARPNTAVIVDGEHLLIGAMDQRLYRLALADGAIAARLELPAPPVGTATLVGDALIQVLGSGYLVAVDRELEEIVWTYSSAAPWSSFRPLVHDGIVIAGTDDGELYALAANDGSVVWTDEITGTPRGIGNGPGGYYIGTLQGPLYAYAPDAGAVTSATEPLPWLAGSWRGSLGEATIEEVWSERLGDDRMGMFRMVADGAVKFYEFQTIDYADPEGPTLRIKHYNPGLLGWEERDESEVFFLAETGARRAVFAQRASEVPTRLVYELDTSGELVITLEKDRPEGTSRTEFRFSRD